MKFTEQVNDQSASYKRRAMQLAIAEAIAFGWQQVMAREAKLFPVVCQDPRTAISGNRRRPLAEAVLTVRGKRQPVKLSASATLTTRDGFIPAGLALRNAIAREGSHPSGMFLVHGGWARPEGTLNSQASYGSVWGGRN